MHEQPSKRTPFDDSHTDDVDRLFAHLDRAPVPDDLTARILSSTVARTNGTRAVLAWPWMLACVVALGVLTIAGYELGASLASSDGLDLVTAVFSDFTLLTRAPGDVLAALGEVIPWTLVAMAGLSAGLLILAAGNIVSRAPSSFPFRARPMAR
jgi:hypothetical protein